MIKKNKKNKDSSASSNRENSKNSAFSNGMPVAEAVKERSNTKNEPNLKNKEKSSSNGNARSKDEAEARFPLASAVKESSDAKDDSLFPEASAVKEKSENEQSDNKAALSHTIIIHHQRLNNERDDESGSQMPSAKAETNNLPKADAVKDQENSRLKNSNQVSSLSAQDEKSLDEKNNALDESQLPVASAVKEDSKNQETPKAKDISETNALPLADAVKGNSRNKNMPNANTKDENVMENSRLSVAEAVSKAKAETDTLPLADAVKDTENSQKSTNEEENGRKIPPKSAAKIDSIGLNDEFQFLPSI